MFKLLILGFSGISFGLLAAAGVFTVLSAVGLIPRFIGNTHTAKEIWLYEDMVIWGTICGGLFSLFADLWQMAPWGEGYLGTGTWQMLGHFLLLVVGLFSGMFVGCLALAVAEMLDSIPIFTRRISFRHGLGLVILSVAFGKLCGALYYFWKELWG